MTVRIIIGDIRDRLAGLPNESVHCVVTSPPYWGLRDYGVEGQIGLEATPDEHIAVLVDVFREVRRVLTSDGTLWLNYGDCYATGAGKVGEHPGGGSQGANWKGAQTSPNRMPQKGLKPKDLVMMPARVALALQADGWWLRSEIIWHKPNPMPESATDRPTSAHEKIYLLAKSQRYYFDAEAVRTPSNGYAKMPDGWDTGPGGHGTIHRDGREKGRNSVRRPTFRGGSYVNGEPGKSTDIGNVPNENGANIRNVWAIATQPFPDAHFATFPPALVEPCIKAGCPKGGTVLDPFGGSGTVGLVADRLGRDAILIELNPEYAAIAERRIGDDAGLFAEVDAA